MNSPRSVEFDFERRMAPSAGQRPPFATLPGDRKYPLYAGDRPTVLSARERQIIEQVCGATDGASRRRLRSRS